MYAAVGTFHTPCNPIPFWCDPPRDCCMLGGLRGARRNATVVSATPLECESAQSAARTFDSIRFRSAF